MTFILLITFFFDTLSLLQSPQFTSNSYALSMSESESEWGMKTNEIKIYVLHIRFGVHYVYSLFSFLDAFIVCFR